MRGFLICPVRGASMADTREYVQLLEAEGWELHWPPRDTDQDDPIGLEICQRNRDAIARADCVFIVWDGKSTGSLFDLGMAFALAKPLVVLDAPKATEGKSFQNMMRAWASSTSQAAGHELADQLSEELGRLLAAIEAGKE